MQREANFQLERLIKGVQDLQHQRSGLERTLDDLRYRKRGLEDKLRTINSRHGQLADINAKMKESLKIAQHKVSHTHAHMTNLEDTYKDNRKCVARLTQKMEDERRNQHHGTFQFENRLTELVTKFKEARVYNSMGNLEEETAKVGERMKQLNLESSIIYKESDNLMYTVDEIESSERDTSYEVSYDEQYAVLDQAEEELSELTSDVQESSDQLEQLVSDFSEVGDTEQDEDDDEEDEDSEEDSEDQDDDEDDKWEEDDNEDERENEQRTDTDRTDTDRTDTDRTDTDRTDTDRTDTDRTDTDRTDTDRTDTDRTDTDRTETDRTEDESEYDESSMN